MNATSMEKRGNTARGHRNFNNKENFTEADKTLENWKKKSCETKRDKK